MERLSLEDLYEHMLAHEQQIAHNSAFVDLFIAGVHFAAKGKPQKGGRGGCHSPHYHFGRGQFSTNTPNDYRGIDMY